MVSQTVTQAPAITALKPIADGTLTVAGSTNTVAASVVFSTKGIVGKPFTVTKDNVFNITGKPLPMSRGSIAEGLRHVKDALDECTSNILVRVVADDYRFPVVSLPIDDSVDPVKTNHPKGTMIALDLDSYIAIYPKDGDASNERRFSTLKDSAKKLLTFNFEEKINGEWQDIESLTVSFNVDSHDDNGIPNFATSVFDTSNYFDCVAPELSDDVFNGISEVSNVAFEGGNIGGNPTTEDWINAWNMLGNEDYDFDLGYMAGVYDGHVIAKALEICGGKLSQIKADIPPWLTEEAGKEWVDNLNIDNYQIQFGHYPYRASDSWYGGKSVWGVSGALVAAKAVCYATVTAHAEVKGAHYACAGDKRGRINRRGIEPLMMSGKLQPEELVEARINPVNQGKVIGDVLNMHRLNNYLRFEHVVAILNAVLRDFITLARYAKFEPDGLTFEILDGIGNDVLDKYRTAQALVNSREDSNGNIPYKLLVEQQELDLWKVTPYFSPTGVARRIAIQPILMK